MDVEKVNRIFFVPDISALLVIGIPFIGRFKWFDSKRTILTNKSVGG
jgi:hypothetical protein